MTNFVFLVCAQTPFFHTDNKITLDQDLDPNTFLSLIGTGRSGPKGQGWNMTFVGDVVVVVQGYTIYSWAIEHY